MVWYGWIMIGNVQILERYQKCLDPTERTIPITNQINARIDIAKQRLKKKSNYG